MQPWSGHDPHPAPDLGRMEVPCQEPDALGVLHPDLGPATDHLRVTRVPDVPNRGPRGDPPLRRIGRGDDGNLVVDAVRLGRRDPVAAVARDTRVLHRRAAAVPARGPPADPRDVDDRPLLAYGDAR